eukprot:7647614-Lingulodinium_polyedra.AAC.1
MKKPLASGLPAFLPSGVSGGYGWLVLGSTVGQIPKKANHKDQNTLFQTLRPKLLPSVSSSLSTKFPNM